MCDVIRELITHPGELFRADLGLTGHVKSVGAIIVFPDISKQKNPLLVDRFVANLAAAPLRAPYFRNVFMQWRNSSSHYGMTSILLHWLVALSVFGLFGLGYWMVGLDYYSSWYKPAPDLHKSIGLVLFVVMLGRVVWRRVSPPPVSLPNHDALTRKASKLGHAFLYVGLFVLMISGYLISTADGRGIAVFGLFEVPATLTSIPRQEDVAGLVHEYLAWALVIFAGVHALAALKHHFIDRDRTLLRMFGR
jgi:cytochrome b561